MFEKLKLKMHFLKQMVHDVLIRVFEFIKDVLGFISANKSIRINKLYAQVRIAGYKAF
jgi:hypothetical protein